jgi:hypothetical protein
VDDVELVLGQLVALQLELPLLTAATTTPATTNAATPPIKSMLR